jgi:NADPH:quinone reductase-like Zn-dependent oxidoreductase
MRLAGPANGGVRGGPMTGSEVRYVNSGGVHIAYRVFGDGPVDLVLVPAFTSHLEQNHEWPGVVRWNARLVSFSRLIVFDKRSTGLSDHAPGLSRDAWCDQVPAGLTTTRARILAGEAGYGSDSTGWILSGSCAGSDLTLPSSTPATVQEHAMKAIVCDKYGAPDVLELREVDKPVVKDDEVLVRVHATSVNPADWHFLTGTPYIVRLAGSGMGFGPRKPKHQILGLDLAGRVEAVGGNVTQFRPGDEVFGAHNSAYAEYVCVPLDGIAPKPANLTFEQAAAVPIAGVTALQGLRDKGQIQPGQQVLIIGASGGVGTFAVQLAKSFGADVTGVCSTRNLDLVRSIGADQVIDYTQEDFTLTGRRYDLIFQVAGNNSLADCRRALTPEGTLVLSSGEGGRLLGPMGRIIRAPVLSRFGSQKLVGLTAKQTKKDLVVLKELMEGGKVTPVIDRRYTLAEVPEALRYQGEGQAQGKTVITV